MKLKYSDETALALAAMSERLETIRIALEQSKAQFALGLGYANQSPLTRIGKGSGFIGPDKLQRLAGMHAANGNVPNINWLLTGLGPMLVDVSQVVPAVKSSTPLSKDEIASVVADTLDYETLALLLKKLKLSGA
jgi:hypothetical protein